jgi:putative transposase
VLVELAAQIGVKAACAALGMPRSRYYPRSRRPPQPRPTPAHALSDGQRTTVRELLNSDRFMDKAPRQVYAALLDKQRYYCHWRTMYRILAAHGEVKERRRQRQHPPYRKPELLATAPNQVWSWDITNLRGPSKWTHFKLYTVLDIYSRCVVGWLLADHESSELARQLVAETVHKQGVCPGSLTLHADNGAPMTGKPLSELLLTLGIERSHSRPHTSNDNPFSEAQFKTMKYRSDYPDRFASFAEAQAWTAGFITHYNESHYHSGLKLFTPSSVHYGEWAAQHAQRQAVLDAAFAQYPARFAKGHPQVPTVPTAVWLNRPNQP